MELDQVDLALERKRKIARLYKLVTDRKAEVCLNRFYDFFKEFWYCVSSEELELNWHIEKICDELQDYGLRIARREKREYDLIINIPPGSSKSTMVSILFPVWLWLHRPDIVVINSSYAGALSIDHSLKSKQVFKSERFQAYYQEHFKKKFGKYIELVKDTEKDWRNNFGGGRFATSTGGSITGKHADLLLRDDSLNPEQAESDAERTTCNRFNDGSLSSRKKKKDVTGTITVMQRLHEDDPTGHDMAKSHKNIKLISIPAELSAKTKPKPAEWEQYYVNGLFDPARFPREVLDEAKADLGSKGYAGQYLQNPVDEGGNKIKEEWLKPAHPNTILEKVKWFIFIDGAYTENTANDPSGIMIVGVWLNKLVVRFCTSKFMEIPELIDEIKALVIVHKLLKSVPIYIEPKASGKSLKQLLVKEGYNGIEINNPLVGENKAGRINLCVPYAEAGRITYLEGSWVGEWMHQLTQFPRAIHDEYVDLTGYSVYRLLHNPDSSDSDENEINPSDFY